ncbi:UNKNOWN [Stylonychia lemnae]|uniref:Inosine/uridine-preferring nucleoside hydrolase domain-containing protein n=1 Tax=Stylonychia lemnae TaxID=5949 RepID=A0A077ZR94_STYLE|nr:UNKNOWN [Stylonychia lemnae]|eukprot:CDW71860.1 UNKNOWN [Stylonychia lemnae]
MDHTDSQKPEFEKIQGFATKVIIDCDPGGDDAHAILLAQYLSKAFNVQILGLTTGGGNQTVDMVTKNSQIIIDIHGETGFLVHKGTQRDDILHIQDGFFGKDSFGGYQSKYQEINGEIGDKHLSKQTAIEFLLEQVNQYPNEITLICMGCFTNIQNALKQLPDFLEKLKNIVVMGGTHSGVGNAPNWVSEYNFHGDPNAAKQIFEKAKNITMISFDLCYDYYNNMSEQDQATIFGQNTKLANFIRQSNSQAYIKGKRYSICDQVAVAVALDPRIVLDYEQKQCKIFDDKDESTRGMVAINWIEFYNIKDQPKVNIVTKIDQKLLSMYLRDCLKDGLDVFSNFQHERQENQKALSAYLEALGIPDYLEIDPSLGSLLMIQMKHLERFPLCDLITHQNLDYDFYSLYFFTMFQSNQTLKLRLLNQQI